MDERGLGKRLQKARQAAGLTQQQLCQQANLSFSTLTKIERGAIKAPSIFTIQAIAGALGVGLDELIGASPAPHRQLQQTKSGASFIYFDMNGCLVHSYQSAFAKLAADTDVTPDVIESVYWRYNDEVCRGTATVAEFNEELAKKVGAKDVNWLQYYMDAVEQIPEMHEILTWAAKHYRVGLLTNTMPGLVSALRRKGLIPDIQYDAIVDSSEVGVLKPEEQIYTVAQERAGCNPEEILFIDDAKANLVAASKLGWNVIWFDDARSGPSAASVRQALEPAA